MCMHACDTLPHTHTCQLKPGLEHPVLFLPQAGGDFKTGEAVSSQLGRVVESLEAKELRWLELAEIAGDI